MQFRITGADEGDRLRETNGLALLIGMLLDQQVPLAWAFRGPFTLHDRLGHLDASRIGVGRLEPWVRGAPGGRLEPWVRGAL